MRSPIVLHISSIARIDGAPLTGLFPQSPGTSPLAGSEEVEHPEEHRFRLKQLSDGVGEALGFGGNG